MTQFLYAWSAFGPLQPHPNFRTVVAADYGPVLDKGDSHAQPGRLDCCTGAGHAAAHDNEFVVPGFFGFFGIPVPFATKRLQRFALIWWNKRGILGQENARASAFKTRQVMQRDIGILLHDLNAAPILPVPLGIALTKGAFNGLSIDQDLEDSRRTLCTFALGRVRRFPWCYPVACSHPQSVGPGFWKTDICHGICHWPTQPMGKQESGSHLIHKLLVEHPTAFDLELGRLQQQGRRVG